VLPVLVEAGQILGGSDQAGVGGQITVSYLPPIPPGMVVRTGFVPKGETQMEGRINVALTLPYQVVCF